MSLKKVQQNDKWPGDTLAELCNRELDIENRGREWGDAIIWQCGAQKEGLGREILEVEVNNSKIEIFIEEEN